MGALLSSPASHFFQIGRNRNEALSAISHKSTQTRAKLSRSVKFAFPDSLVYFQAVQISVIAIIIIIIVEEGQAPSSLSCTAAKVPNLSFCRLFGASEEEQHNAVSVPPVEPHPPGAESAGSLRLQQSTQPQPDPAAGPAYERPPGGADP